MEFLLERITIILLIISVVSVAVAFEVVRKIHKEVQDAVDLRRKMEGEVADYAENLARTPLALPKIQATPCDYTGPVGWVELQVGPHKDAVRVALRTPDGDPTHYGMQVLRILLDHSDPSRSQ